MMQAQSESSSIKLISRLNSRQVKGSIFKGEALDFLNKIESNKAAIVFVDPPFNIGKDYGNGKSADRMPHEQYLEWLKAIIKQSERILKVGGAFYLYHLPRVATEITGTLNELLMFRHWIAVSMKNTFARGKWLYPAHYALLYYTKGDPIHFERPKIAPKKCRECNAYIKDYGGYKKIIEKKGINLSDIWDDISPVRHATYKTRISNELPTTLVNRIVAISGAANELYVDPFSGSGNGVLAAISQGMNFSCCDLQEENCLLVSERIKGIMQ